ncbi:DUF3103 family protein [Dyella sp. LX-66]|uniref:DUF3103 family protein n=1 Tax=unclassified Dyella TaxID=2634549 RepID=UPI001BE075BE|nr:MULTISPECIES: DUF3103 family protein [unclassified Dyella]MBT2118135.1 DUF3103 family protein [Dyella sp. LX-1]MBT2138839.1 DUF3103 family protein [Dyella sp. LX-66]
MITKTKLLFAMLAATAPFTVHADKKHDVQQLKEEAAKSIAKQLQHANFSAATSRMLTRQAISGGDISVPLHDLLADARGTDSSRLGDINRKITATKGLSDWSQGVLQLRLYLPDRDASRLPAQWKDVLVAVEPSGDESERASVPAFDAKGNRHDLDAKTPPRNPVLILDVDGRESGRAGALLVNHALRRADMQVRSESEVQDGAEFTVLSKIRVKDAGEDWVRGAAEVFAVISGVQPGETKAQIELKDMSYLDWWDTDYAPFQDMIAWKNYGLDAANVQLFEQDDWSSYADIAASIINKVNTQLPVAAQDPASLSVIGQAVINSIDSGNDYIDSFYLIEKKKNYDHLLGANNNATASFCFHVVGNSSCRR